MCRWLAIATVLCAHANAFEVATDSETEFAGVMNNLKQNAFVDAGMDMQLTRSLRENLRGPQGIQGVKGDQGDTGPKGDPGVMGQTGPVGPKGQKGQPGARGPQGTRGMTGPRGPDGAEGPTGMTGPRGEPGLMGPKGAQGVEGPQGPIGPVGPKGEKGPVGPQGPRGYQGPKGEQGFVGDKGATGPMGKTGPQGPQGMPGAVGATGRAGATGPQGPQGPKGPKGAQGPQGRQGDRGATGDTGQRGPQGVQGPQGPRGKTGTGGPIGEIGPMGPKGDQGPRGPHGVVGKTGPQGDQGKQGQPGPAGVAGPTGEMGSPGRQGERGPRGGIGPVGAQGPAGPMGNDGSLRKYTLTGGRRFMLEGGENSNVNSKIYSGQENNAPILYLETQKTPVAIKMYQTKQREKVAAIYGMYGNVGIGEDNPQAKLHVKGQVLLAHNFNNVISVKEKRKALTGSPPKEEEVEFDLIGTYWGMNKKAVYIGAFTGQQRPGYHAEEVVFGGTTNEPKGKARVVIAGDNAGKIYAAGFVTDSSLAEESEEAMSELEAESLIQVSAGDKLASKDVDLGRSTRYLHRKVREQAATIEKLERQIKELKGHLTDITSNLNM